MARKVKMNKVDKDRMVNLSVCIFVVRKYTKDHREYWDREGSVITPKYKMFLTNMVKFSDKMQDIVGLIPVSSKEVSKLERQVMEHSEYAYSKGKKDGDAIATEDSFLGLPVRFEDEVKIIHQFTTFMSEKLEKTMVRCGVEKEFSTFYKYFQRYFLMLEKEVL